MKRKSVQMNESLNQDTKQKNGLLTQTL